MAKQSWGELGVRTRRLLIGAAAFEGTLKLAALIDLARRPATEVRGSKLWWALAITLINAVGLVPITYFVRGRRHA